MATEPVEQPSVLNGWIEKGGKQPPKVPPGPPDLDTAPEPPPGSAV